MLSRSFFLFTLAAGNLFAQATGQLTGSVVDPTGASVPGARISLMLPNAKKAALATTTTSEGLFSFNGVRPGSYILQIEAKGFTISKATGVAVDALQTTSLSPIKLELQTAAQTIDVTANPQQVQTSSTDVATTISQSQVEDLPVLDRQVSNLFLTQAGVNSNGRSATTINGQRESYSNLTLDGINIQDNFIRTNDLDFLPNKLTIDEVQQITVATSNVNSNVGSGASQINLTTPSGSNQVHGSVYWYNRNNALAANDWFNNQAGVAVPRLNLNQVGGSIGGYIIRDKLFYFANYEAYRLKQSTPQLRTILTPSARQGLVTFPVAGGKTQTFDVLKAQGLTIDPVTQNLLQQIPSVGNSSNIGDGLNTTGYQFNARSNETRDNITGKLDYNFSEKNAFSGVYRWSRDIVDRTDATSFYTVVPPVYNDDAARIASLSWRWNPKPHLVNELRGGFNLTPTAFNNRTATPQYFISGLVFDSPQDTFQNQGRSTNTYQIQDNATYIRGRHTISFGFQSMMIRTSIYDEGGTIPTYGIGLWSQSPYGFSAGAIPNMPSSYVGIANALQSSLAGLVSSSAQTFNVTSRTSGFVPNAPYLRHWILNNYAAYVTDTWKVSRRLTAVVGLRWEYYSPVDERDALVLLPQIPQGSTYIQTLLTNSTLNFAGSAVGRPLYNKDLKDFAPNIGLAWDVFGDGKTAFRAGYSIHYVNDDTLTQVINNASTTNSGLAATADNPDFNGKLTGGLTPLPKPVFQVPRTFADNYAINPLNAQGLPNPNLTTPYVQEWNVSIQRAVKGFIVEGRYVGNHGTKEYRQFDYNQIDIVSNGFLADFQRAQANGFLSLAAGRGFNPGYTGAGTQRLTVFPKMVNGGFLTNPTVSSLILQGQAGTLAEIYTEDGLNGPVQFFANPNGFGMNTIANYSNSVYDSLQLEVRKRTAHGMQFQANYTYCKVLTDDSADNGNNGFTPFLDIHNPGLDRSRANFDLRHAFKVNHVIPLPFGEGQHFQAGHKLNKLIGGWAVSGFLTVQSGPPFSILSGFGTFNRSSRSVNNGAITLDTGSQLQSIVHLQMTGNGPVIINPSAVTVSGQGIAPYGSPPFQGQVFFNPAAGQLGTLQKLFFSGPWFSDYDFSVGKEFAITERHRVTFRADFFNIFNHANFAVGDQNINSTSFGKINSMFYSAGGVGPRIVQFGLRYKF